MKKIITTPYEVNFEVLNPENKNSLCILLHGFMQDQYFYQEHQASLEKLDAKIIIPRGPYPIPGSFSLNKDKLDSERILRGFAWYLFNPTTGEYIIDYNFSVGIIEQISKDLNPENLPVTLVGYSQGGYLSVFASEHVASVTKIIGINCNYRYDKIKNFRPIKIIGINGEKDKVVDPIQAQANHQKMLDNGCLGHFNLIKNTGHAINNAILDKLIEVY